MPKAFETWTVLPHDPVETLADNLRCVVGRLPDMPLPRTMVVACRSDGRLVIHNPIALQDERMAELEGWGEVAFVIVPNGWHRLDAAVYRRRYPNAKLLCPAGSRKRVEQVVAVNGSYDDFPADDAVAFEHVDGLAQAEGVMRVRSADGVTLVFADVVFNLPHQPGLFGFIYRLTGSTGGPRVTRVMKLWAVKNKKALRDHLERLAATPDLTRVVPGHGDTIAADAPQTLRDIAATV